MATGKRYYWIKLRDTFMTSDAVDFLMGQPNGANYVVLYQMLCLKTINTDGRLERRIGEIIIPYDEAKIQRDTKYFSEDTIRVALGLYKALGLVYEDADGCLVMANHSEMVGSETDYAEKKRRQRKELDGNMLLLEDDGDKDGDNGRDNVPIDIRDKRLDIRDKDNRYKERFERFWKAYPKKVAKDKALKAFEKIKPNDETVNQMIDAIELFKQTKQWKENNGQFIPYPATWLNQKRWEDEDLKPKHREEWDGVSNPFDDIA